MERETKLKTFLDVFDDLSGQGKNLVEEKIFKNKITESRLYPEEDPMEIIWLALQYGIIYEPKAGFYSRT